MTDSEIIITPVPTEEFKTIVIEATKDLMQYFYHKEGQEYREVVRSIVEKIFLMQMFLGKTASDYRFIQKVPKNSPPETITHVITAADVTQLIVAYVEKMTVLFAGAPENQRDMTRFEYLTHRAEILNALPRADGRLAKYLNHPELSNEELTRYTSPQVCIVDPREQD